VVVFVLPEFLSVKNVKKRVVVAVVVVYLAEVVANV
jgi:hypothetical protein